jgi:pimeloyl-ACP methyl ester carboxylesterase
MMETMHARNLFALTLVVACGGGSSKPDASVIDDAPIDAEPPLGDAPALAQACTDSVADVYTLPDSLPAMDDTHRGDVFRCAVTEKLTAGQVRSQIAGYNAGYQNTTVGTVNSGFWTYRIAFRSERNTLNSARAESEMAAVLFVPEKPLAGAPLVVFGHGSVGIAPQCAPSHKVLTDAVTDDDFETVMYRLAGYGYTVIAPDYAGFSYDQVPGYFNAEDEAHAILDATRAAAKILPTPPDKVVFVGHSQGGHAVLAAQSYAPAYGMTGTLVGVATFAPLWSSMSLWAAITTDAAAFLTTNASDQSAILYSMAYAYSASELRAPGTGLDVFQDAKKTAARDVMLNQCYDGAGLQALGAKPSDFFDPSYVTNVGGNCAVAFINPNCSIDPAPLWKARWIEDRPAIDATSSAPVLAYFGDMDSFIPHGRAACIRDKITADLAAVSGATTNVTYCLDPNATHRDIVRGAPSDYVLKWIAARAGAGAEPAACPALDPSVTCSKPPNEF